MNYEDDQDVIEEVPLGLTVFIISVMVLGCLIFGGMCFALIKIATSRPGAEAVTQGYNFSKVKPAFMEKKEMKRLSASSMVNQITPTRSFWIIEGSQKPFAVKDILKRIGARFDDPFKSWYIENPNEAKIAEIKKLGLQVQHRRYGK